MNSIIHDVLSKKSKEPVDIMVLDYKQMFDSECLFKKFIYSDSDNIYLTQLKLFVIPSVSDRIF